MSHADHPRTAVGQPILRREDAAPLTGTTRAVADVPVDDLCHLAILRSPVAHGWIRHLDVAAARAEPGVVAAYTAADLADDWRDTPAVTAPPDANTAVQPVLARDKVRFVGEPIAVVVATSPAAAADAVEAIHLELDPLPAVIDLDVPDDPADEAAVLHEELGTNTVFTFAGNRVGDVASVFDPDRHVVVHRRLQVPRLMGGALEPRATLAVPEADGTLRVHTSTQAPHRVRGELSRVLGLEPDTVRVIAEDVGGGFGVKLVTYPEDLLVAAIARRLDRPVRHVATRSEDLQSTGQGRGQIQEVTASARPDGTLVGLAVRVTGDCGAYLTRIGAMIPLNADKVSPGCYRWEAFRFDAVGRYTNTVPVTAYRGAGRPEAIFAVERIMDELAAALQMDPAELRRRNLPAPEDFPFPSIGGLTFDSGDYAAALDRALTAVDVDEVRAEQARRRAAGDPKQLGLGLACHVDRCGPGPGLTEYGAVRVDADGHVEVASGLGPTGQGTATTLAQLVSDALGVDLDRIRVVHGDTGRVPEGTGTFGSRSMAVGAIAVVEAAQEVADEARRRAAVALEAAEHDIELADGRCQVRGSPEAGVALAELVADEPLAAQRSFEPEGLVFPYGAYAVVVEVDTETGAVTIPRFVAVDDAGEVINPLLADGQIHGGIAQGVAAALYEEVVHDEVGNPLTGSFIDYLVPTAPDLPAPELHRLTTPSRNALGVKGVGEAGTIGAPPAVVNAVIDAVRHLGVQDVAMPCTPQRVWEAITAARGR